MRWELSLPKPPMLVYYFAKFNGLAPFNVSEGRFEPPTLPGKLYSVFVAAVYFLSSAITAISMLSERWASPLSRYGLVALTIHIFTSYSSTFLTMLTFILMYEKILYIMNKLYDIGNELKILGIEENLDSFFNNTLATIVFTNVAAVSTYVIISLMETNFTIGYMASYGFDNWFQVNMILIFVKLISFIEKRFKLMNERLYDVVETAGDLRPLRRSQILEVRGNPRQDGHYTDVERVRIIEGLHMDLCDLIDRSTNLFAIPTLLKTLRFCTSLIVDWFWIYFVLQHSGDVISAKDIVSISRALFRICLVILKAVSIAWASARACNEGNSTRTVVSKARYNSKSQELEDEFLQFSIQLLHKPVDVSAFGFFHLGYSSVYKILGTAAAYIVVLIQFDDFQPNPDT